MICPFILGKPRLARVTGLGAPQAAALIYSSPVSGKALLPKKNLLLAAPCPLGVNTSATTVALLGTTTGTVNTALNVVNVKSGTLNVCVPTNVRVPPGKAAPVCVYKRTTTG